MPQDLVYNVNNSNETIIDKDNYQFELNKKLRKMYDDVYNNRLEEQIKYKNYYDIKHKDIEFSICDRVLILFDVPTKGPLMSRWEGPFTIIEKVNPGIYKVENDQKIITIHVQRIKLANSVYKDVK